MATTTAMATTLLRRTEEGATASTFYQRARSGKPGDPQARLELAAPHLAV